MLSPCLARCLERCRGARAGLDERRREDGAAAAAAAGGPPHHRCPPIDPARLWAADAAAVCLCVAVRRSGRGHDWPWAPWTEAGERGFGRSEAVFSPPTSPVPPAHPAPARSLSPALALDGARDQTWTCTRSLVLATARLRDQASRRVWRARARGEGGEGPCNPPPLLAAAAALAPQPPATVPPQKLTPTPSNPNPNPTNRTAALKTAKATKKP